MKTNITKWKWYTQRSIVANLRKAKDWLDSDDYDSSEAVNVLHSCLLIMCQAYFPDIKGWWFRKNGRARILGNIQKKARTKVARKMLAEAIDFAGSCVEAAPWRDRWTLGPMPEFVRPRPQQSPETIARRQESIRRNKEGLDNLLTGEGENGDVLDGGEMES